jgi:hypothetical protein
MPDADGRIRGIAVPPLPWEDDTADEALSDADVDLLVRFKQGGGDLDAVLNDVVKEASHA